MGSKISLEFIFDSASFLSCVFKNCTVLASGWPADSNSVIMFCTWKVKTVQKILDKSHYYSALQCTKISQLGQFLIVFTFLVHYYSAVGSTLKFSKVSACPICPELGAPLICSALSPNWPWDIVYFQILVSIFITHPFLKKHFMSFSTFAPGLHE